jgi:hypothetical protein
MMRKREKSLVSNYKNELERDNRINNKTPIPHGVYRHYKGNLYEVIGFAKHSETLEEMVVYKALYGDGGMWVRPLSMWDNPIVVGSKTVKRGSQWDNVLKTYEYDAFGVEKHLDKLDSNPFRYCG